MSKQLSGGTETHYRSTDHSEEILALRNADLNIKRVYPVRHRRLSSEDVSPVPYHIVVAAVVSLLETHDATGISLEQAPAWSALVNVVLHNHGLPPHLPNGV